MLNQGNKDCESLEARYTCSWGSSISSGEAKEGASWQLQLLTGSGGAALSSALGDSNRARGNGMELWQGSERGGSGKGFAPEGGGHGANCPGRWARPLCWSSKSVWTKQ